MLSRFMFWLTLGLIVVVVAGVWHLLDRPVAKYVVDGQLTPMEQDSVQKLLAAQEFDGILSTSLAEVEQSLADLAWAREVGVRRVWPDQLHITLQKEQPLARWGDREFLSASGRLLELPDEYQGLPQFRVSISEPAQALETYRLLSQIASRANLTISSVVQNEQGEWQLIFRDGPVVLLGSQQISERMHRYLTVHRQVLAKNDRQAQYVDLRYTNGVAVKFPEADMQMPTELAVRDLPKQMPGDVRLPEGESDDESDSVTLIAMHELQQEVPDDLTAKFSEGHD